MDQETHVDLPTVDSLQAALADKEAAVAVKEAELSAANTKITALQVQVDTLSSRVAADTQISDKLLDVVKTSINTMAVALNATVVMPEDASGVLAMHDKLRKKFAATFPAGAVASVAGDNGEVHVNELPAWTRSVPRFIR